ncbi:MAG: transposase family protein [bacterium]|nr:transposase family protein [bacterium]
MFLLRIVWSVVRCLAARKADLVAENLALRQQLIVLDRKTRRPRLRTKDRVFWLWLARSWDGWRESLIVVKPETIVRWQRQGFKYYWTWKSRHKGGRPAVAPEVRDLIRKMSRTNPLWGAPRIHGELHKLGIEISQATVSKYMIRHRKPPSQGWRTFLDSHVGDLISIDFFAVPTVTFRVLFVFVVLIHDRRRVVHFNVTDSPTTKWTGQQIVKAFPWSTAPRSPWQNPYVERVVGTLRRDCIDHAIVFNENHLRRLLQSYLVYYHECRTHLSLEKDSPEPRKVESPDQGKIVEFPMVGGLHHRYARLAA